MRPPLNIVRKVVRRWRGRVKARAANGRSKILLTVGWKKKREKRSMSSIWSAYPSVKKAGRTFRKRPDVRNGKDGEGKKARRVREKERGTKGSYLSTQRVTGRSYPNIKR